MNTWKTIRIQSRGRILHLNLNDVGAHELGKIKCIRMHSWLLCSWTAAEPCRGRKKKKKACISATQKTPFRDQRQMAGWGALDSAVGISPIWDANSSKSWKSRRNRCPRKCAAAWVSEWERVWGRWMITQDVLKSCLFSPACVALLLLSHC